MLKDVHGIIASRQSLGLAGLCFEGCSEICVRVALLNGWCPNLNFGPQLESGCPQKKNTLE
jgi:hypothetical protein